MPKKIDPAVKERAVRRVLEHRGEYSSLTAAAAAVAKQERLGAESVRRWVLQAEIDAGDRVGTTAAEYAEIKKLKAENAQLREDVAILKAATRSSRQATVGAPGEGIWPRYARARACFAPIPLTTVPPLDQGVATAS